MLADKAVFQKSLARELRIHAVVRKRCECGEPNTGWDTCPACKRAAVTVDHGLVAYRHKNWWMNLAYKLGFIK